MRPPTTPKRNDTGWYPWDPGVSSTTLLTALPNAPDYRGWVIDPSGGATGFAAGNWSFTVVTDTPGGFTSGAAELTVGIWKANSSGVTVGGLVALILGTLRLPALLGSVGLTAHRAVGTNLVVGFFLGVSGFLGHAVRLEVEWAVLGLGVLGALPGAWLGARASGRLSERALQRAIGVALLVVAAAIAVAAALDD